MSEYEPRRADIGSRLRAGFVAVGSLTVLGVAAGLNASEEGLGTHTQLGMPPCMFREATGYPCMTCGMTTSFSHAADMDLVSSASVQPVGLLLAILTAAAFWASLGVVVGGSTLGRQLAGTLTGRVLWIGAAILAAGWAYKLLTASPAW